MKRREWEERWRKMGWFELKFGKMFCKAGKRTGNQPISVEVFLHRAVAPSRQDRKGKYWVVITGSCSFLLIMTFT